MNVNRLFALFLLAASALVAQDEYVPPPDGQVGVRYSYSYSELFGDLPSGEIDGVTFSYTFSVGSGTLPPGLTLSQGGTLSGIPTTAGNFTFVARVHFVFLVEGQDFCVIFAGAPCIVDFPETITITGASGPPFTALPNSLSFTAIQGAAAPPAQSITLSNSTAQPRGFTAQITYLNGSNWLSLATGSANIAAFSDYSLTVTSNTAGLSAGSYRARIDITPAGSAAVSTLVTLIVTNNQPAIVLSQSGLYFRGVQGGTGVPAQTVTVLNSASTSLTYTANPVTFSGTGWLAATVNGSSLEVRATPGSLAPGDYYGQVSIAAQGVTNSPQAVAVVLRIEPATALGASVSPSALIFAGRPGGSNPAAQTITIANYGRGAVRAAISPNLLGSATNFLTVTPASATIAAGATATVSVRPNLGQLPVGVYNAEIGIVIDGTESAVYRVAILFVVAPGAGSAAIKEGALPSAAGCTPTRLLPVFTALGSAFKVNAGWPTPIEVRVVDDCGDPLTAGAVTTSFSNSDPALPLQNLRDGRWSATWQPRSPVAGVVVSTQAALESPRLTGSAQIGGSTEANPNVPIFGAAVSAASFEPGAPIAPGAFVSVFGVKVGGDLSFAPKLPLETTLDGVQVILGGKPMPLHFTSEGQINAIVPYDTPVNTTQQILVRKGVVISVPATVNVTVAQPALFTRNQSGKDTIVVEAYRAGRDPWLVTADDPAQAGDILVLYCTGLGAVQAEVPAGSAAPSAPTVNPVSVRIGGVNAPAPDYAGLTAGFAGLYQINVAVPAGIAPGNAEIIVTVGGVSSPAGTTIPVK